MRRVKAALREILGLTRHSLTLGKARKQGKAGNVLVIGGAHCQSQAFDSNIKLCLIMLGAGPLACTDAHRGDVKRFVVRADERLTAFLEPRICDSRVAVNFS